MNSEETYQSKSKFSFFKNLPLLVKIPLIILVSPVILVSAFYLTKYAICNTIACCYRSRSTQTPEMKVTIKSLIPFQDVTDEYPEFLYRTEESWIKDPLFVALNYTGYPNRDNNPPSKIYAHKDRNEKVTIIISNFNARDDSIKDTENRIDLINIDGTWKIEWAGYRQRCRRSPFNGWTTGLCP